MKYQIVEGRLDIELDVEIDVELEVVVEVQDGVNHVIFLREQEGRKSTRDEVTG